MKSEVRRGRKFVEYHDPETQDEFTFTQEISGADVSYQETDGSWLPADENWQTDGLDGYILKNDKLNHKVRLKGTGGRTWYPRRNVTSEYMTFGVPQYWNGKRWANFGFTGWSVEGKTITLTTNQGVTILVHNRWNGIKIDWVLASSTAPPRMRYPVALTGITEIAGVLFGADGAELGRLTPTTATDANGAELVCSGSFAGGYVEFQADVSSAQFPVTIDPDFTTTSTAGDTNLYNVSQTYNYGTAISLTFFYGGKFLYRFDLSSIDSGNTVSAASLKLTKSNSASGHDPFTINFYKIADANGDWIEGTKNNQTAGSGEPCWNAKKADGSGGVTTAWAGSAGMQTAGTDYINTVLGSMTYTCSDAQATEYTCNFNSSGLTVIQSWLGENTNNGICTNYCSVPAYQGLFTSEHATESYRPKLAITYTAGATGALRRTNMNAQMSNLTGGMHG